MVRALRCIVAATLAITPVGAAMPAPEWHVVDRLFFRGPIANDARGQGMTGDGVR